MKKTKLAKNDRIEHEILGRGTVRNITRTGGGREAAYVEFDTTHPRLSRGKSRYGTFLMDFLKKSDEKPVEFGMNILDI